MAQCHQPRRCIISDGKKVYVVLTGHNPFPDITPQVRIPRSVARPDKTHRITHRRLEKLNFRGFWSRGLCPVGLRPPILKFSFQNTLSCNRKRHRTLCSNSTGVMSWGFRPALPLTGGSDPGDCVRWVYVRQSYVVRQWREKEAALH